MKISWNGTLTDENEAVITVFDHGFLYGLGLFETFRTYYGRPFLLTEHLQRLHKSAKLLGIQYHCDPSQLSRQIKQLMEANGLNEAYVRLTVSAGQGELGLPTGNYEHPNQLILVKALAQVSQEEWMAGRDLRLLRTRRNTPEGEFRFKSLHYMNNIIAKRELQLLGTEVAKGTEGLMLTGSDVLAEGIVSNLFFVMQDVLYTPSLDTGILPGVTRALVIELANQNDLAVVEGQYKWEQLLKADEVFMTNSIQELIPITRLIDQEGAAVTVGNGTAGVWTRQLYQAYRHQIDSTCLYEYK